MRTGDLKTLECERCGREVRVGGECVSVLCGTCTVNGANELAHEAHLVKEEREKESSARLEAACSVLPDRLARLRRFGHR